MKKNKIVLLFLFVFPILTYLIFATAKHNSLFLPTISKNNNEIPTNWTSLNGEAVQLKNKITILGFVGDSVSLNKGNLFNLNQKIYNKYFGFKDFQLVMIAPLGTEKECQNILNQLKGLSEDLGGWHFVFTTKENIKNYYNSYNLQGKLDETAGTPMVMIIDKELNHRGRKGENKKGEQEYKESYNTISAADLHNEMSDDVKIILREYRLALKKNNERKDSFRDKIKEQQQNNQNER
ncbi:hypothetical protein [Flavobacterium sp.]|uniref:hypothetical protein n=1 Tax=Flavobacterium sp. TaxID=239 RepID=UPI0035293C9D